MITTAHTEQRIVNLMEKGAKVIVYTAHHIDFGSWTARIVLEHNGRQLKLSHAEKLPNIRWDHDGFTHKMACPINEDAFTKRSDIKEGYAGWQSDYANEFRRMFEHISTPTPRWIAEQWDNPVTQYDPNDATRRR